jgi:hypothetical protein
VLAACGLRMVLDLSSSVDKVQAAGICVSEPWRRDHERGIYRLTSRRTSTLLSRTLTSTAGWGWAVGPLRARPSERR